MKMIDPDLPHLVYGPPLDDLILEFANGSEDVRAFVGRKISEGVPPAYLLKIGPELRRYSLARLHAEGRRFMCEWHSFLGTIHRAIMKHPRDFQCPCCIQGPNAEGLAQVVISQPVFKTESLFLGYTYRIPGLDLVMHDLAKSPQLPPSLMEVRKFSRLKLNVTIEERFLV